MAEFFESDELEQLEEENILPDEKFMPKLPQEYRLQLEKEWNKWNKEHAKDSIDITDEQIKEILMKELTLLSDMTVEEYNLYRKWAEIHRDYPVQKASNNFWDAGLPISVKDEQELNQLKHDIWQPTDINDYKKLKPRLVWTNIDPMLVGRWNKLRTFIHTQINNSNIGRNLYFIVVDDITRKYLGVINVSSDYLDMGPRDNYIGWSKEVKTQGRMINHTAVGSTICPTQPLGYNYVGGKLMALLTISKSVEDAWLELYGDILVGMTTTSLYSSFSQYQNLTYWTKRGHTAGVVKYEPSREAVESVKKWLQKNYTRKYWEWYVATEPQGMPLKRDYKQRSLAFSYAKLGIDKKYYEALHQKGIYFCPFYTNTKEFLKKEIPKEQLVRRFDNSVDSLVDIWKEKYASKRIIALTEQNRVSSGILFYDDIINMSWEETKNKYLKEVGR